MPERKYTINPENEEIVITTPRKKTRIVSGAGNGKGIIQPGRKPEYLARRKKATGFLQFFDVGQRKNESGDWITNQFHYLPTLDWTIGDSASVNIESLPSSSAADFEASLLAVGAENLKTTYRKIEPQFAPQFPLLIQGEEFSYPMPNDYDEHWTDKGLKLTASEAAGLFAVSTPMLFPIYAPYIVPISDLTNTGQYKVTATPDFSAAATPFTPKPGGNWYLMPRITLRSGLSQESAEINYELDLDYKIRPRYFDDLDAVSDGSMEEATTRMAADTPFRAFKTDTTDHSVIGSLTFPFFPDGAAKVRYGTTSAVSGVYSDYLGYTHALAAVVEQGGTFYYIWRI